LLIFPVFRETGWASLAVLLNSFSLFPCCLWQPQGVPRIQIWNLAALAPAAPEGSPRGTRTTVPRGPALQRLKLTVTAPLCTMSRVCGRESTPTLRCSIRRDSQKDWLCWHSTTSASKPRP